MADAKKAEHQARVLIVDDETDHADVMCEALIRMGHKCDVTYNLTEAEERLGQKKFDVIVTDMRMDGPHDGLELIKRSRDLTPPPPVILVTAVNDVPTSKAALQEGAYDYITKPLDLDEFRAQVNRAAESSALRQQNEVLEAELMDRGGFEGIIGKSPGIQNVIKTAKQIAPSDIPVLITGESGTGKELIARAIHDHSQRRRKRLVALNCAGLAETILEDELFGHVKGAYTGAQGDRAGRFEHADKGTLFLDEVGDMPQSMQAKLLRVLENGEVVRLGSNEPKEVDVRLVSATNRNLQQMVDDGSFRQDLYFRIKGVTVHLPPLRERREDIPLLTHFFLKQSAEKYGKDIAGVTAEAQQKLMGFSWPGNVRQLKTAIEEMVVLATDSELGIEQIPEEIKGANGTVADAGMSGLVGISVQQAEKELIRNTLEMTDGNREKAAKMLGIGERTLYRKIKEYELK
ncbi:MAG: sigma-54 dependent transcriptional regulator [Planctomycetota bacterium]